MIAAVKEKTKSRLIELEQSAVLTGREAHRCKTLLENLERCARVAVLGAPGSGKSTLIRSLLGGAELPECPSAKFVELTYGEVNSHSFNQNDTWSNSVEGLADKESLPAGCEHLQQQLSLPDLANKQFAEITLANSESDNTFILGWLTDFADIVVLCTRDLDGPVFEFWAKVPDRLKDHSFLALTFADEDLAAGTLARKTDRFGKEHAEEFMGLFPVATRHALSAFKNGKIDDDQLWQASGVSELNKELEREIKAGQQAGFDQAEVFLMKFDDQIDQNNQILDTDNRVDSAQESLRSSKSAISTLSPMKRSEAIATALTVLQAPVDEMLQDIENDIPHPAHVLDHTAQAAQALATLFMDASPDDQQLNAFRESVLEYEQMTMLLQLEGTETAAHDAVTGLLQLKKEMSEVAYA